MFDRANGDEQESLDWPLCADTESEKILGPVSIPREQRYTLRDVRRYNHRTKGPFRPAQSAPRSTRTTIKGGPRARTKPSVEPQWLFKTRRAGYAALPIPPPPPPPHCPSDSKLPHHDQRASSPIRGASQPQSGAHDNE